MCRTQKEHWIREILSNDESSSDTELVEYFMENKLSKETAIRRVIGRSLYRNNIVPCDNSSKELKNYLEARIR